MAAHKRESILRENPHDRRSLLSRLSPLSPIGDIAGATLSETVGTTSLTWESATDWDNQTSEDGVVHEDVANTDLSDATLLQMGYPVSNPLLSSGLVLYYPLHEDSGSTANDFSGNNYDGTAQGGVGPQGTGTPAGPIGVTSWDGDGSGDWVDSGQSPSSLNLSGDTTKSIACWCKTSDWDNSAPLTLTGGGNSKNETFEIRKLAGNTGEWRLQLYSNDADFFYPGTGDWIFQTLTYGGSSARAYMDGTEQASVSASSLSTVDTGTVRTHRSYNGEYWNGAVNHAMVWNRGLSASEVSTLYDVVGNTSSLTTSTKSFGAVTEPDLQNLDYSLNSQSITLDVIGSPGTASEEIVSQSLDGATSYSLTWSSGHTDFRVKINFDTTDDTVTPTVNRVELGV